MRKLLISSELKCLLEGDFSVFFHVREVTDKVDHNRWGGMVSNFPQPLVLDVFKARPLSDVKHQENAVAPLIEIACDRAEALLTRSVPNLQLDVSLLLDNHSKVAELDSNRHTMLLFKGVSCEAF